MANYSAKSTVVLDVNGQQAKKKLDDLQKKADECRKKMDACARAGDMIGAAKWQKEANKAEKEFKRMQFSVTEVGKVLGNLDKASLGKLKKTLSSLRKDLNGMERDSEQWKKTVGNIRRVKAEIDKVNASMKAVETSGQKFKNYIGKWATGASVFIGQVTGFFSKMEQFVDKYAAMQAEEANVMKYTGMSEEDVATLNARFRGMDTRTSREDLNRLAQEAGRLGKTSVEDVLGFVKAADQINVALDDLGEGATLTLSKLTNIFGVEAELGTEKSLLAVGSVINELSQNCTAGAGYLAEFSKRMAGVGAQAHLSIQQIMAFAAVLDSQGQNVEAASTALSQLIMKMYKDPAAMAKAAGMDVKAFSETVKKDANEALLMLLETLSKYGGIDSLASIFGDMHTDGARMSATLAALAGNVETVKWQQQEANKAFADATSVTKEFNVQNNTVQAGLDKAKKKITDITVELGEKLQPVMEAALHTTAGIMSVVNKVVSFISRYKTEILTVAAAITAYNVVLILNTARLTTITKATALYNTVIKAMPNVLAAARLMMTPFINGLQYLRNGLEVNYEMQQRWRKSMQAMNFASWTALLLALASAVYIFTKRLSESRKRAQEAARAYAEVEKEAQQSIASEIKLLDELYNVSQNQNESLETRLSAINKLREIYPSWFKDISDEAFLVGQAADAYDRLRKSILESARAKGRESMIAKLEGEIQDLNAEYQEKARDWVLESITIRSKLGDKAINDPSYQLAQWNIGVLDKMYKPQIERKQKLQDSLAAQNADYEMNKPKSKAPISTEEDSDSGGGGARGLSDKELKKQMAEARRAEIKAKKEFKEQLKSIEAERDTQLASLLQQRAVGDLDFKQYQEQKYQAEKKFYDDSIKLYEDWNLREDADHAELLKKREEREAKYNSERFAINKDVIRRIATIEEREARMRHEAKSKKTLADELQLQEELMSIRFNALMDELKLHDAGSKEYLETERKIEDLLFSDREEKRKILASKAHEFEQQFNKLSVKEKYDLEIKALELLYEKRMISETEFQKWEAALEKSYNKDSKEEKDKLPGSAPETNKSKAGKARENYNKQKAELDKARADGIIDEDEYTRRLRRIKDEMNKALVDPLRNAQSEWASMLTNAYQAWADFASALKDPDADPFEALSAGITATAAVVSAVMSQITEFQKAEYEIQAKAVEKRYDKEIRYAEGNTYLTKKLEKQKEKELARLKAEQTKKSFQLQVIATIAQTAANAVQAYGAALSIPGVGLAMAPIAAAMAVAQGAVQIALLKKQQQAAASVGYSEGGFTRKGRIDEPAGIVHAGEWVASQKLVNSPKTRPLIEMLEYAQRNNRIGSISMEQVSRSVAAPMFNAFAPEKQSPATVVVERPTAPEQSADPQLSATIARLNERLDRPFVTVNSVTGEFGIDQAEKKYKRMMRNKSRKSAS